MQDDVRAAEDQQVVDAGLPPSFEKETILVVDDAPDNLSLMNGLLKGDYKVKVANSGERALKVVAETPPDLILLDIMMPGMDGHEVCRRLKDDPASRDIPVIFLTAKTEIEDEKRGLELGAVDYITKPISPPIVLARVKNHLALCRQTRMLRNLAVRLARYIPSQVLETILDGTHEETIQTRRKKLTLFFSDIKDFTETTGEMAPEDLTYLLNKYFSEMSAIAVAHGATIDKFIGDAMVMFFGDPQTRGVKEDALRCVRMAVAMQHRMADLQALWRDKGYDKPFRMRIGINTGFCNVGNFGSDQRMDYTVIGAEVNLAARLEQMGEPDGIMLSYETYALVRDEFDVEEQPPIKAKGIAGEIRCFALKDIPDLPDRKPQYFAREQPGMRLTVNLAKLTPERRQAAIDDLEAAIDLLRKDLSANRRPA